MIDSCYGALEVVGR